ncbi:hypothetical protein, partial [Bacteroides ovatus]|uniref:hypothetical protein n=1 Tax=Bacteroides ovatus TaxID=28116 RepID=UPI003219D2E7
MGRFHGYVPKMHPLYRCAGTASHIGDFPDYACYVAVLFLPDRVSVMELLKRGVVRISDANGTVVGSREADYVAAGWFIDKP